MKNLLMNFFPSFSGKFTYILTFYILWWKIFRYILYVSAVDQSVSVDDRRTSMSIVEVRIEGSLEEDRPKPEKQSEIQTSTFSDEENEQQLNNETEEFLKEAKRRVIFKQFLPIFQIERWIERKR